MKIKLENIRYEDNAMFDKETGKYIGTILYRYTRGSRLYNTCTPESDWDEGGIYVMPNHTKLGLGFDYQEEIKDEKGDAALWEIGRFLQLTLTSNPTVLEALFVPDDKVIYEHPIIKELRSHRNEFVTKKCFMPLGGYAISQIKKAQGQDKKIHWDIEQMTRKTPLDFCYTFHNQGSQNIQKWLDERGLDQRNCGLVNVPNMPDMYGVYYDFGQHMRLAGITRDYVTDLNNSNDSFIKYIESNYIDDWTFTNVNREKYMGEWYDNNCTPIGSHCGIISPNEDSNEIRFSSVEKLDKPICFMSYGENGYKQHCRKYKEYLEWKQNRNKARYENNLKGEMSGDPDMKYDSKNIMHCFRLMAMCIEVAEGKGIILDRTGIDRDFLLNVRNRKFRYSELKKRMDEVKVKMDDAISKSTIKEDIDVNMINNLLLKIRKEFNGYHN